jgi:hypothetical protein
MFNDLRSQLQEVEIRVRSLREERARTKKVADAAEAGGNQTGDYSDTHTAGRSRPS